MSNPADRIEIITSVQRRRRWTAAEKVRMVEETFEQGMTVDQGRSARTARRRLPIRSPSQQHQPGGTSNLVGKSVHRRFGISGVELCDDHHTLPPLLFVAPPPFGGGPGECLTKAASSGPAPPAS